MEIPAIIDVLCVGMATYDLTFTVNNHPYSDEKIFASNYLECGGGPASNASVTVSRLGGKAAYAGYLGNDLFGQAHFNELIKENINCGLVVRKNFPTRLSIILAKPNGDRAVVTYQENTPFLINNDLQIDFRQIHPKTILFDGHEPEISVFFAKKAKKFNIPIILDAGSVHKGTLDLLPYTDYLVCSEKFAKSYIALKDLNKILIELSLICSNVIITLGKKGLMWKTKESSGKLKAYKINSIDTTGAGDTFHGAFALGIAKNKNLIENLTYSNAAAALCCTKIGARNGIPKNKDVEDFINK